MWDGLQEFFSVLKTLRSSSYVSRNESINLTVKLKRQNFLSGVDSLVGKAPSSLFVEKMEHKNIFTIRKKFSFAQITFFDQKLTFPCEI